MAGVTDEQRKSWPTPNYDTPENHDGLIIGITVPLLALAIIFLAARFYGRGLLRMILGADDWIMLLATLLAIPVSVFPMIGIKFGLGLHIWDQKPEWYTPYWKMGYAADLLFPAACSLTKISLCVTYLRLFPGNTSKVFCYVLGTFVVLFSLASFFLSLFQCRPIRGYWDPSITQQCINMRAALVAIAALNSLSDFLIYLYPAKPLWSLHLPIKQRLGLICLFSIGLFVCIAGVLRMYYLEKFFTSFDPRWNGVPVWLCMVLEMNIGIICACLSGVKPVLATLLPILFGTSYRTRSGNTRPKCGNQSRKTTRNDSFTFDTLPYAHGKHNAHNRNQSHACSIEAIIAGDDGGRRNFAWASANGNTEANIDIPSNAIGVSQEVSVEEEDVVTMAPGGEGQKQLSDAGSEEWIMDAGPTQCKV
ncbi:hypothetical protein HBI56_135090 [Parastagonospora nodorum]|uniref:Rhodopsin domain-containing protein n=1 Tax=Phaeosphaeria nodorum (strain SN15 / ATCC MYA-4574 / FGSC 10173) TaxID=321614 RepID=A0A7U2I310_PHANO|nr:hypothetical protein HBH56_038190 [Parastagonospora nodorum]QRC99883.1 hypothetical protein JI435_068160 [Parastagonospora nodorum SN15]KAH3933581.1 hypothetical protein HBH54_061270 [Parastagonospora nodorum]KAH3979864.1 hypothetical protein HBH51_059850 [Parastagonospora nodorum]KAH4002238.1 hypothetical protein HBI10_078250 [Parastagonospora nodorum]